MKSFMRVSDLECPSGWRPRATQRCQAAERAGARTHSHHRQVVTCQCRDQGGGQGLGIRLRNNHLALLIDVDTGKRPGRRDHRSRHRHGFENLVLHAVGNAQGDDDRGGMGEIGAHVIDAAGDDDTLTTGEPRHRRARVGSDDIELQIGDLSAHPREHPIGEPRNGVDIRPVIHGAGENDGFRSVWIGKYVAWREIARIDAVAHHRDFARELRRQSAEEGGLAAGGEDAGVARRADAPIEVEQRAAFARVDPAHGASPHARILPPLVRVDVAVINQQATRSAGATDNVLRHHRGADDSGRRSPTLDNARNPPRQAAMMEVRTRERVIAGEAMQRGEPGEARPERREITLLAEFPDRLDMLPIDRVVDKAAEIDAKMPAHITQDLQVTDLLALCRRVRNALRKEQQVVHGQCSVQ